MILGDPPGGVRAELIDVVGQRQADLFQIVGALRAASRFTCRLDRRFLGTTVPDPVPPKTPGPESGCGSLARIRPRSRFAEALQPQVRKVEAAGIAPASLADVKHCQQNVYNNENGGCGNCTRHPVFGTHCPQCGYALSAGDAQEMCRDCVALRELVISWHRLTPEVRDAIMKLVRSREA